MMRAVRSIRFKIVLWYTLILALVLSAFSGLVYINLRRNLYVDIDEMLELKAEGVADSIETYWATEKADAAESGASAEQFSKIDNINFLRIAQRWVTEQSSDPKLAGIFVDIIGPRGEQLASSSGLSGKLYFPRRRLMEMSRGRATVGITAVKDGSGKNVALRSFLKPIMEKGRLVYVVQVSSTLDAAQVPLRKLRFVFLVFLPLTALLSVVAGFLLARLLLMPLKRIIGGMHAVTADNLKHRIEVPDTRDEIRELADNFNAMLDKLDGSFSSQQQLIQDISHELRTPLTILKGEMELALKRVRSTEEYTATLQSGLEEIDRISRIVEDLLVLSRFDGRGVSLDLTRVRLDELLAGIIDDVRLLAERKKTRVELSAVPAAINADEHHLRRVFLNLIDNALKYTPEGGGITITVNDDLAQASVRIADTGPGIPEESLPFIFNRFYRVDKARSSEGFGLGLSIAQSIIQAHHGRITVENSPGSGSVFTVFLPH
jgi:heavy metal sensor kinase